MEESEDEMEMEMVGAYFLFCFFDIIVGDHGHNKIRYHELF